MEGYLYDIKTRKILIVVSDVKECGSDFIKGKNSSVEGISELCSYTVSDIGFKEGDILPEGTSDFSDDFKSKESIIEELRNDLQAEKVKNNALQNQLAQVNSDLSSFMEYYFTVNPE